jgi:hypothetical protein
MNANLFIQKNNFPHIWLELGMINNALLEHLDKTSKLDEEYNPEHIRQIALRWWLSKEEHNDVVLVKLIKLANADPDKFMGQAFIQFYLYAFLSEQKQINIFINSLDS